MQMQDKNGEQESTAALYKGKIIYLRSQLTSNSCPEEGRVSGFLSKALLRKSLNACDLYLEKIHYSTIFLMCLIHI